MLTQCSNCKRFHPDNEPCLPSFMVHLHDDKGDLLEGTKIHAVSHNHAARCYAVIAWYHLDREELMKQRIIVDVVGYGKTERFQVQIDYWVHQIETP